MGVICISHATGAGGERIGHEVAERIGYRYMDEEIVRRAAELENLDPEVLEDVERRHGFLSRLLESLERGAALDAMEPEGLPHPDVVQAALQLTTQDYRALIREAVHEAGEQDDVVIVAHAASMALAGRDALLRVLVTAPPETRAERLARDANLSAQEAKKLIRENDRARADYFKRFYGVTRELPTHYDLVINTTALRNEQAVAAILSAARA